MWKPIDHQFTDFQHPHTKVGSTSFQDDTTSSPLETNTTIVRSAAPSSVLVQVRPQPVLSTSAIAGVAIGGILALSLIGGGMFFLLRRRRRYSRASSPPVHEPDIGKLAREKAGLDEPYSGIGVGGPVGFAELDGSAPVSPVMEPLVHLSASQRQARVAQNF
ncbi:hypothetical protein E8E11_008700 [Didymella keratinophila]|nr:hypothetical protein E8E11_008700 [Didymella keratinophila]